MAQLRQCDRCKRITGDNIQNWETIGHKKVLLGDGSLFWSLGEFCEQCYEAIANFAFTAPPAKDKP